MMDQSYESEYANIFWKPFQCQKLVQIRSVSIIKKKCLYLGIRNDKTFS